MTGDGPDTADSTGSLESNAAGSRDPGLPRRIGHYTVKRLIGSGGMGAVYEAVQEQPRRVVALKVLRAGIAGKSALRRFEYESQLLARLRHPGIAQVYEAGTHESEHGAVPFFAMEYIPGARAITDFAAAKKLGTRERMDLIARVCDAVHHGHQKGIIHRDLKPGNILVDSTGDPKIIDFGVARATDSDMAVTTLQTDIGQLIGTLAYMSPEQCAADPHDIDVRSDVYALGVVLYELLCGRMPYDVSRSALAEATRKIREEEPAKLSTLDRTLRGDPETIALKALEKERERRYRSAADLADDIRRYLKGEPISARPPSVAYQVRVFAKRHRALVGAVAAILVVTSAAAVVSARYWYDAARARDEAVAALKTADLARGAEAAALIKEAEARRGAEAEAMEARFRESAARRQAIEARRTVERLTPLARAEHDLAALAVGPVREDLPAVVRDDSETWLCAKFPELFESADGRRSELRVSIDIRETLAPDDENRRLAERWVRENAARVDGFELETRRASFRYGARFGSSEDLVASGLLLPMGQLSTMSRVLVIRGEIHHSDGERDLAYGSLRGARRLARDVGSGSVVVCQVVEYRLRNAINAAFRSFAVSDATKSPSCRAASEFVQSDAPLPSPTLWAELEKPVLMQLADEMFSTARGNAEPSFDRDRARALLAANALGADADAIDRCAEVGHARSIEGLDRLFEYFESLEGSPIEAFERFDTSRFDELIREYPLLGLFAPMMWRVHQQHGRAQIDRDATIITAALCSWRASHGQWPASIGEAIDEFPIQPMRRDYYGHDFVYRVEGDGPVLYSIGPDRVDDGGTHMRDESRGNGDLVYVAPGREP